MSKILAAIVFLALNAYVYWQMGSTEVIPPRASFSGFPNDLDGWHCSERDVLDDKVINNLRVTDYLSCGFFEKPGPGDVNRGVHLYIGYHERQTRDRETGAATAIHPPEHCLPGSGWDVIDSRILPIEIGAGGEAKRFVIAKGSQRALVYFWYQSRGRAVARGHEKILWLFLDRARYGRTDGALVRFTIPIVNGDMDQAEETFHDFARLITPRLSAYVPD
ncbi:MAG TPA: EpsI family protein [Myxococcota bacterium]|nr:EpsI family protein [Myxococcales bacterium]HPG26356.1 EpsI family protein [Myxococcota bacterium]